MGLAAQSYREVYFVSTEQKFEPGVRRIPPSERPKHVAQPPLQATPPTAAQIAQAHAGAPPANPPQASALKPAPVNPASPSAVARQAVQPTPRAPLSVQKPVAATGLAKSYISIYSNGKAAVVQRQARAQRSRPGVGAHAPRSKDTRATLGVKR